MQRENKSVKSPTAYGDRYNQKKQAKFLIFHFVEIY